ncbi:MAG: Clp protease ClpP [Prevotellaceae bacterium]|jgi:ATP-dependent protease ClpP protease subunit|nr:Clp protease ClpP [Prevotellaceae bacterium]
MTANSFYINASRKDGKALIRITGTIGLDASTEPFRSQVDSLVNEGVKDVHLYINSPGGSCFDAAEIVNIIQGSFKGKITGEGGALVASAASFIALHCSTFSMPENGMFMIHKPSGGKEGNVGDLESYTKLLKDIENQYYNVYKKRTTNPRLLDENWKAGDWWMTAREARDNGFITDVRESTVIDRQTSALISACGCPRDKFPKDEDSDERRQITEALGLPDDAGTEQILEAIARLKGEETPEKAIKNALKTGTIKAYEQSEFLTIARTSPRTFLRLMRKRSEYSRAELDTRIENRLKACNLEKRILATDIDAWRELYKMDYNAADTVMKTIEPVARIDINPGAKSFGGHAAGGENRTGWTLDDYRKKDPKALFKDPELYNRLLEKEQLNN